MYDIQTKRIKHNIIGVCDKQRSKLDKMNYEIRKIYPNEVEQTVFDFLVVTSTFHFEDIRDELINNYGIEKKKIVPIVCLYLSR